MKWELKFGGKKGEIKKGPLWYYKCRFQACQWWLLVSKDPRQMYILNYFIITFIN